MAALLGKDEKAVARADQMLGRRHVAFKLVQVDDAPMIGAAVAALFDG